MGKIRKVLIGAFVAFAASMLFTTPVMAEELPQSEYEPGWHWTEGEYEGGWIYVFEDYTLASDGVYSIAGKEYAFDYQGIMLYGAARVYDEDTGEEKYLYADPKQDGAINRTPGWKSITEEYADGDSYTTWYYVGEDGYLYSLDFYIIDGKEYYFFLGTMTVGIFEVHASDGESAIYITDENGVVDRRQGWKKRTYRSGDEWYYSGDEGALYREGFYTINGKEYYFDEYCQLETGVFCVYTSKGNAWFFSDSEGVIWRTPGWKGVPDGYGDYLWYYITEDGSLVEGSVYIIDGIEYYFGYGGRMQRDGKAKVYDKDTEDYYWVYALENGALLQDGWYQQKYSEQDWIYAEDGVLCHDGFYTIDGNEYYFDDEADMCTGVFEVYDEESGEYKTYKTYDNGVIINNNGWVQDEKNDWYYYLADGTLVKNEFKTIGGGTYYFNSIGIMQSGYFHIYHGDTKITEYYITNTDGAIQKSWIHYGNEWYYAGADGRLLTKQWKQFGSTWYYFDARGAMETGYFVDAKGNYYHADSEGRLTEEFGAFTGWKNVEGIWYYFKEKGVPFTGRVGNNYVRDSIMLYDTFTYDSDTDEYYYLDKWGNIIRGWYYSNGSGEWYYADANGYLAWNEWKWLGGKWYYFGEDHQMVTGVYDVYNKETGEWEVHQFHENGVWIGEVVAASQWKYLDGNWYYFDESGYYVVDEYKVGDTTYYFDAFGRLYTDTLVSVRINQENCYVYVDHDGKTVTLSPGWHKLRDTYWFYVDENGKILEGLQTIDGVTYYLHPTMRTGYVWMMEYNQYGFFGSNGARKTVNAGWYTVGEDWYYFKNGKPVTGYYTVGTTEYYFDETGRMAGNEIVIARTQEGARYVYNASGLLVKNQWMKLDGYWYYGNHNGKALIGEHIIDGVKYVFDEFGRML